MAGNLEGIERQLGDFMARHGAILSEDSLDLLSNAEGLAAENKFHHGGDEPNPEAVEAVEEIWGQLEKIENALWKLVVSQSST